MLIQEIKKLKKELQAEKNSKPSPSVVYQTTTQTVYQSDPALQSKADKYDQLKADHDRIVGEKDTQINQLEEEKMKKHQAAGMAVGSHAERVKQSEKVVEGKDTEIKKLKEDKFTQERETERHRQDAEDKASRIKELEDTNAQNKNNEDTMREQIKSLQQNRLEDIKNIFREVHKQFTESHKGGEAKNVQQAIDQLLTDCDTATDVQAVGDVFKKLATTKTKIHQPAGETIEAVTEIVAVLETIIPNQGEASSSSSTPVIQKEQVEEIKRLKDRIIKANPTYVDPPDPPVVMASPVQVSVPPNSQSSSSGPPPPPTLFTINSSILSGNSGGESVDRSDSLGVESKCGGLVVGSMPIADSFGEDDSIDIIAKSLEETDDELLKKNYGPIKKVKRDGEISVKHLEDAKFIIVV